MSDADAQRAELAERWDRAARGWGRRAERVRDWGMPVSALMIEQLALQSGQRVLELAAGPGDTGFLAAELIAPRGTLVSSDASQAMLAVARERARALGIDNVEFKQLELEWIDLPTASVDAVLCRWGVMLAVDPSAALREMRRVLAPGGRLAAAVWSAPEENPWATVPGRVLIDLGHSAPPDPNVPGPFAIPSEAQLRELLHEAGFVDVRIWPVDVVRRYASVGEFLEETTELSMMFADVYERLTAEQQAEVERVLAERAAPFRAGDGSLGLPGRSLVAAASA